MARARKRRPREAFRGCCATPNPSTFSAFRQFPSPAGSHARDCPSASRFPGRDLGNRVCLPWRTPISRQPIGTPDGPRSDCESACDRFVDRSTTMHSLILAAMLALSLGPMGPDAPAREPQLAASGSTVALTFGAGSAIYFTVSHAPGGTFSTPVKVEQASNVVLTHHRGPRIAISGKTIVISAIISKTASSDAHAHGAGPDGDLFVWRSTDGGKTWSH